MKKRDHFWFISRVFLRDNILCDRMNWSSGHLQARKNDLMSRHRSRVRSLINVSLRYKKLEDRWRDMSWIIRDTRPLHLSVPGKKTDRKIRGRSTCHIFPPRRARPSSNDRSVISRRIPSFCPYWFGSLCLTLPVQRTIYFSVLS